MERVTPEYAHQHRACPQCGSLQIYHTTAGGIYVPDTNTAQCLECKWHGIVDNLKAMGA